MMQANAIGDGLNILADQCEPEERSVVGSAAAAVQMRMMKQVLAPGVQHGEEANLGAQVLGIGGAK